MSDSRGAIISAHSEARGCLCKGKDVYHPDEFIPSMSCFRACAWGNILHLSLAPLRCCH